MRGGLRGGRGAVEIQSRLQRGPPRIAVGQKADGALFGAAGVARLAGAGAVARVSHMAAMVIAPGGGAPGPPRRGAPAAGSASMARATASLGRGGSDWQTLCSISRYDFVTISYGRVPVRSSYRISPRA